MDRTRLYLRQLIKESPRKLFKALGMLDGIQECGNYFACKCPLHEGDNNRSFNWFKDSGFWVCYTHGCHGNARIADGVRLVEKRLKYSPAKAMEFVKQIYNIDNISSDALDIVDFNNSLSSFILQRKDHDPFNKPIPAELIDIYKCNHNDYYQKQRGYHKALLDYFDVGYCPKDLYVDDKYIDYVFFKDENDNYYDLPYFSERAVIPIHDFAGNLVGFTGRDVTDSKKQKFIHTSGMKKSELLYNWHRAKDYFKNTKEIIICESPGVTWAFVAAGFHNVVATFNNHISKQQIKKIVSSPDIRDVIIAYDGDEAGRQGTQAACEALYGKVNVFYIELPDGKDYDSMSYEEISGWVNKRKVFQK